MNILLYQGIPSYFNSIPHVYFVVSMFLALTLLILLILDHHLIQHLIARTLYYPDRSKKAFGKKNREDLPSILLILSTFLLAGSLGLSIMMILAPYGKPIEEVNSLFHFNRYLVWIALTVVIIIYFLIKYGVINLSAFIIQDPENLPNWGINLRNINFLTSYFILVVCISYILGYVDISIFKILIITIISLNILMRILTTLVVSIRFSFIGKFNFFIYLCTLEILPILLAIKVLQVQSI